MGFLRNIDNTTTNVGGTDAQGLDVTMTYAHETSWGDFKHSLDLAYYDQYDETLADGSVVEGVGYYDLGVYAEWKANFNMNFRRDAWTANWNMRYTDDYVECEDDSCTSLYDGSATPANNREVDDYFQHDLQVGYDLNWNDYGSGQITFGIQNVFDEDPAQVFNGFLATSDETAYDFLGRYFYLSYRHTL